MEFKTLVYLILGIAYFVYSFYKKTKEEQATKPPKPKPKQSATPAGKPKNWLEEATEKMQQKAEKAKQQSQQFPTRKSPPPKPQPSPLQKRENFVTEMAPAKPFEEGEFAGAVYERPLTSEEILHNERMKAAQNVLIEAIEEEQSSINAREAFIGSLIFERKF